ncbi:glycine zipper 2TM domain-containing protein [Limnohabitans sp. Rim28]|uniref:glycine zipper 2TM domain-containing protein n=1 Tax=Limnohabitans sp. Rim28 TaxID=1100720 RepID=UPI0002D588CB|nr:glycine zipper 2TM domain-containing protein [Limnohabitans sp. Rim28]PVE05437.1 hypothetical protein B472_15260 [Limnohabitans sp. Rim28]
MKTVFISCALLGWTAMSPLGAWAQELGQVLSKSPVYQQVMVPRQTCTQVPVVQQAPSSGAGALMGAIAGGAMGNAIGDGSGRALATVIGIMGGAMVGERIEGPSGAWTQNQTQCSTQNVYENRLVGYNVVYEYAGKQYTVQLPQDPGATIALQVIPVNSPRSEIPPSNIVSTLPPVTMVTEPRVVYVPTPVYRSYPPVFNSVNLGWGWSGGHRHGHWR